MFLELDDGELVFRDQKTRLVQGTEAEAEAANRRLAEEQYRLAEEQRREADEQRRLADEQRNTAESRQRAVEIERDQERQARVTAENNARLLAEELSRLRARIETTLPDPKDAGAS